MGSTTLKIRLDTEQLERWKGKAGECGISLSEWIRGRCEASSIDKQAAEVKKKLEEFNKQPGPGSGAGNESGQETPRTDGPKSEARRSVPDSSTGPGKVTTIPSRHRPPEKERKAKKPKESGMCPHGFMVVDGITACPRCA